MEGSLSSNMDAQALLVSSFLEIAVGQTPKTALQFLQATNWNLEEAIQLLFVSGEGRALAAAAATTASNDSYQQDGDESVRPPIPVVKQTLYDDDSMIHGSSEERSYMDACLSSSSTVWESDNLASLYRPPFDLMFQGSFEKAKAFASAEDKWLLVNLQSTKEFNSHMLNRDTWANEAVAQTIETNFIFWQVYDDETEGMKVCSYYRLKNSFPAVLLIDSITGQSKRTWYGMIQPEDLLQDLEPFFDCGPRRTIAIQQCKTEVLPTCSLPAYPSLPPEEHKGDKNLICRVGVRLPDGRRVKRNFQVTDPIQLLWSFCHSQLGEEIKTKQFHLKKATSGAEYLDYESKLTFGDSGVANSMVLVLLFRS